MAAESTVVTFEIELSDIDRGIYESLSLKVAQHPSETAAYLATRVLAFALEQEEGLTFSNGLSSADDPPIWSHDLTGLMKAWIDVGTPDGSRLHKARKAADRVAVYCHKESSSWLRNLAVAKVHESQSIALYVLPQRTMKDIGHGLERRNIWSLSRMEGTIYLEAGDATTEFIVAPTPWPTRVDFDSEEN